MLVLTRRRNETLVIGDDIEVRIVSIAGSHVQLGITAPKSVPIYRKEVYFAIQSENAASLKSNHHDLSRFFSSFKKKK